MGEGTVHAGLDFFPVMPDIFRIPRTMRPLIKRTKTEQTIDLIYALMTGIILTFFICEKTIGVHGLHILSLLLQLSVKYAFGAV